MKRLIELIAVTCAGLCIGIVLGAILGGLAGIAPWMIAALGQYVGAL